MRVIKGDLFKPTPEVNAICIPTNMQRDRNGDLVMGAGVALYAKRAFPYIERIFGARPSNIWVTSAGDYPINDTRVQVVSFPTKNHWKNPSNIAIINRSANDLNFYVDMKGWKEVWLPPVGCGLGGLDWEKDVKPVLSSIFDDRFVIVFKED